MVFISIRPPNPIPTPLSSASSSCAPTSSSISLGLYPPMPTSLDHQVGENVTMKISLSKKSTDQRSSEDIRLLAISTRMTELSFSVSDIQTRIFEIQELRHRSQTSGDSSGTTSVIDQSLMSLDEKLDAVEKGMDVVRQSLDPFIQDEPSIASCGNDREYQNEDLLLLRKHVALVAEWEAVQDESEVLREELKEDKWLTVFRTVTDQADGMMSSLEKAVNRCQDFIWQVHRRLEDCPQLPLSTSHLHEKPVQLSLEVFTSLLESFEAKKKHYMPATSKVLSIIDKGVRDRVTKNGETLRRHAESAQRWRNLRERILRSDKEMETVRKILLNVEASVSENGSSTSGTTSSKHGYFMTPPNVARSSRNQNSSTTLSRSISPFRKFARKITRHKGMSPVTPSTIHSSNDRISTSEPSRRRKGVVPNSMRVSEPPFPLTPDGTGKINSQSLTPDSLSHISMANVLTPSKGRQASNKQPWNSSTKVEPDEWAATVRGTPPKRSPSSNGWYGFSDVARSQLPPSAPHKRSVSRASMSSRPLSPVSFAISNNSSSPFPSFRPPSRAQTPARRSLPLSCGVNVTPRPRARTPSHIPQPSKQIALGTSPSSDSDDDLIPRQERRPLSPACSVSAMSATSSGFALPTRPPSRSMIPVPCVHLSSPSRPSSALSDYLRVNSYKSSASRAQTPEPTLRSRVQLPFSHVTAGRGSCRSSSRKIPPSSFKEGAAGHAPSRSGSRSGLYTQSVDVNLPLYEYIPGNSKDPLDVEIAATANSLSHGLLIERVDPPNYKIPKDGDEIKAQYAVSTSLGTKVVTCKLTTLSRSGKSSETTKRVMCRVGGGWQDLSHYILNRQAGY